MTIFGLSCLDLKRIKKTSLKSIRLLGVLSFTMLVTLQAIWQVSHAAIDVYEFDNEVQEHRYRELIDEFRCPKCQNQNLAGSDAPIAQDLKQKTYDLIMAGQSDQQIREYMFERYGDFISYKPPIRPSTWILWFFPPVLLLMALIFWYWRTRKPRLVWADDSVNDGLDDTSGDAGASLTPEEQVQLNKLLSELDAEYGEQSGIAGIEQPDKTKQTTDDKQITDKEHGDGNQ